MPPGLEGVVSRLLCKDREERYDSTKDLAKDLKGLRDALIASVTSGSLKASSSNPSARWAWLGAPLLVVLIAAAWWGLERGREPTERPAGELGAEGDVSVSESAHVIAVLPFENIAADPAQDYFSAGMTEEVSGQLAKLASLQVMSRAAIESEGNVQDLSRLADALGIGSVVTGSVRQTPERVRINVQLVDARTKRTLWSEQYDRALEDIFEVQSDVALQIAGALEATLSPDEQQRIEKRPTEILAAYELYLRSREFGHFTTEGLLRSVSLLEQAVELDPGFALAYARMARQLFFLSNFDDPDYWEPGLEAARKRSSSIRSCPGAIVPWGISTRSPEG